MGEHVVHYFTKYAPFIYRAAIFKLDSITAQDVYQEVHDSETSSPGMDLWVYDDLKLLPIEAFVCIAEIVKLVEQGAPWPDQLFQSASSVQRSFEAP